MHCPRCGAAQPEGDHRYCPQCGAPVAPTGAEPTAAPAATPAPPTPPAVAWVESLHRGQRLAFAGALATVAGSFMAWVKVTAPFVGTVSMSGTDGGDGYFTILLGLAAGVLAWLWGDRRTPRPEWLLGVGVVIVAFTLYEWIDISGELRDLRADFAHGSVAAGLFFLLVGGVLVSLGGELLRRHRPPSRPAPPP